MFYSQSKNAFYSNDINGDNMPSDVVKISIEQHQALISGQSQGKKIAGDAYGNPILIDAPPPPPEYQTQFDSLGFMDLFTDDEELAIVGATMQNVQIKRWYDKMLAANFVSLEDDRTIAGLDALVSAGLITPSRKAEILTPQLVQS